MNKLSVMLIVAAFASFALPAQAQSLNLSGGGAIPSTCKSTDTKHACTCSKGEWCVAGADYCLCSKITSGHSDGGAVPAQTVFQRLKSAGPGRLPATCTSTDKQHTCNCGTNSCISMDKACACMLLFYPSQ